MASLENNGEAQANQAISTKNVPKDPRTCPKLQQKVRVVLPKLSDAEIAKLKWQIRAEHNKRISEPSATFGSGFKNVGEGTSVDDSYWWMTANLRNDGADAALGELELRRKYGRNCLLQRCRMVFGDPMAMLNHLKTDHLENNVPIMKEGVCAQIQSEYEQDSDDDEDLEEQMEADAYLIPEELAGKIDSKDWAKARDRIRDLEVIKQLVKNREEEQEEPGFTDFKEKLAMLRQLVEEQLKIHFQAMKEEIEAKLSRQI